MLQPALSSENQWTYNSRNSRSIDNRNQYLIHQGQRQIKRHTTQDSQMRRSHRDTASMLSSTGIGSSLQFLQSIHDTKRSTNQSFSQQKLHPIQSHTTKQPVQNITRHSYQDKRNYADLYNHRSRSNFLNRDNSIEWKMTSESIRSTTQQNKRSRFKTFNGGKMSIPSKNINNQFKNKLSFLEVQNFLIGEGNSNVIIGEKVIESISNMQAPKNLIKTSINAANKTFSSESFASVIFTEKNLTKTSIISADKNVNESQQFLLNQKVDIFKNQKTQILKNLPQIQEKLDSLYKVGLGKQTLQDMIKNNIRKTMLSSSIIEHNKAYKMCDLYNEEQIQSIIEESGYAVRAVKATSNRKATSVQRQSKQPSLINQKEQRKAWHPNKTNEEQLKNEREKVLEKSMTKIMLVRVLQYAIKDKHAYKNAVERFDTDEYLKQVAMYDISFRKQLEESLPESYFLLNKLIKEVAPKYIIKSQRPDNLSQTNKSNAMMNNFKEKLKLSANSDFQIKMNSQQTIIRQQLKAKEIGRNKNKRQKYIYPSNGQSIDKQIKKIGLGNKSTQKIRKLIQKHFMTSFTHSIKKKNHFDFNFKRNVLMNIFKEKLFEVFPENQTIGEAYRNMSLNLWSFKYIHEILKEHDIQANGDSNLSTPRDFDFKHQEPPIDHLLKVQTMKQSFYYKIKKDPDHEFLIRHEPEIMKPQFLHIENGEISIRQENISEAQTNILKEYVKNKHIKGLIIDQCGISDKSLEQIIIGLNNKTIQKIVISNTKFGQCSLNGFTHKMSNLREIWLNNIQQKMNQKLSLDIINMILEKGDSLRKLRLSNINLNYIKIIDQLMLVIEKQKDTLSTLNLSHASLDPKMLYKISQVLDDHPQKYKNLDLSYNTLNMHRIDIYHNHHFYSRQFINNMSKFFYHSELLNHLDISGMQINQESIEKLCEAISTCPNLMSIHMNDLGINQNHNLREEILNDFEIDERHDEELTVQQINEQIQQNHKKEESCSLHKNQENVFQ